MAWVRETLSIAEFEAVEVGWVEFGQISIKQEFIGVKYLILITESGNRWASCDLNLKLARLVLKN